MSEPLSYEQYLENNGSLTYTNVGVSMLPLLREGRDLFTVRKKGEERCRKGDVVLYRRPPDKYVLHRVVEVRPDSYVILGDNCVSREYGITDSDILGVMTGFVRDGKQHSTDEAGYRLYTALMLHTAGFRIFIKRSIIRTARLVRRLIHEKQ